MKVLCVLYDDPKTGMPEKYARDDLPKIEKYPDGMTLPSPKAIDFTPGEITWDVFQESWVLENFLEDAGHTLVVTSDKDGEGCEADRELVDADIVISQPFFPYYLTKEKMETAPNLKWQLLLELDQIMLIFKVPWTTT